MIFESAIRQWQQQCPWREVRHVEQDLILHAMIQTIYADPFLSERLAFRGGTCLNKLYLKHPYRYSEDLDFVQINAEKIGEVADRLKKVLAHLFEGQPSREAKKGSFRLNYSFLPEGARFKQKIKVEINTREHFAVKGYILKPIRVDSPWYSGTAEVVTFSIEELLATKLRALYQRRKGRDLFDLWVSRELKPDYRSVVEIFSEYMKRNGHKVSHGEFTDNLHDKMQSSQFLNDIKPIIRPEVDYDPNQAAIFVNDTLLPMIR